MADCSSSGLPTRDSLEKMERQAEFITQIGTSRDANDLPVESVTNPDTGVTLPTMEAIQDRADTQYTDIQDRSDQQFNDINDAVQNQYIYARVDDWSAIVGQTVTDAQRWDSWLYLNPIDSQEGWYGPKQSQVFPIVAPVDPSNDDGWALVSALTKAEGDKRYTPLDASRPTFITDPRFDFITGVATDYPSSDYAGDFSFMLPDSHLINLDRDASGKFTFSYNPVDLLGTNNRNVYISSYGLTTGDGPTPQTAITWARAEAISLAGGYSSYSALTLYLMDDIYDTGDAIVNFGASFTGKRLRVKSVAPSGRTYLTAGLELTWSLTGNGWESPTTSNIGMVCNRLELDSNGVPIVYERKDTLIEMQAQKGSYYHDESGNVLYVNAFTGHNAKGAGFIAITQTGFRFGMSELGGKCIVEDITFVTNGTAHKQDTSITEKHLAIYDRCMFVAGRNDSFYANYGSYYYTLLNDCVGAFAGKDVFNYHFGGDNADNGVAVEINCKSYYPGKYKYPQGSTTTNSCNASTAHDGSTVFRFGGDYYECEGMVVADINGCKSITYGCFIGDNLASATGDKSGLWLSGIGAVTHSPSLAVAVDVFAKGKNMESGINVTVDTFKVSNVSTANDIIITSTNVEELQ